MNTVLLGNSIAIATERGCRHLDFSLTPKPTLHACSERGGSMHQTSMRMFRRATECGIAATGQCVCVMSVALCVIFFAVTRWCC